MFLCPCGMHAFVLSDCSACVAGYIPRTLVISLGCTSLQGACRAHNYVLTRTSCLGRWHATTRVTSLNEEHWHSFQRQSAAGHVAAPTAYDAQCSEFMLECVKRVNFALGGRDLSRPPPRVAPTQGCHAAHHTQAGGARPVSGW